MTATRKTPAAYEIVNHGIDNAQYFPGCGVCLTEYTDVATGIGDDYAEALEDALDSLAQNGWDTDGIQGDEGVDKGVSASAEDDSEDSELYYYVSVRVR